MYVYVYIYICIYVYTYISMQGWRTHEKRTTPSSESPTSTVSAETSGACVHQQYTYQLIQKIGGLRRHR